MPDQIPAACAGIQTNIDNMNADLAELQQELRSDPDISKVLLQKGIAKLQQQIAQARQDLAVCIANNTPPVTPPPVIPAECLFIQKNIDSINADLAEAEFEATHDPDINQELLAKGIAKLNKQLLDAKAAFDACVKNPPPVAPLATKPQISADTTKMPVQKVIPWALVQRKMDDFFNKRTDPQIFKIRFNHHDHFTGNGDLDNDPPASDVTLSMLEAEVVNGQFTTSYSPITTIDLGQLSNGFYFNDVNSEFISVSVNPTDPLPITIRVDFETAGPTDVKNTSMLGDIDFLIFNFTVKLSFNQVGLTLDFLSWLDNLAGLTDDDLDNAVTQYVGVHITSSGATDFGGAFQKRMRLKLYEALKANRFSLNSAILRWMLGGKGFYDVTSLVKDAENVTINYQVPANQLDPFPDSMIRPAGWPYHGNPKPTIKLTRRGRISKINHIVVLTMENRSFDHMLGYLSLPLSAGGMGRTDIDGLKGNETNSFDGLTASTYPFAAGDTAFPFDPAHSYEPVFRQINATLDSAGNAVPGTGKMDGFVKSAEIDKIAGGAAGQVMGHQPAVNVPVYDALVRDFGISDRWFSSHPGPTFCNRFYELTGRLNLDNGLGDAAKDGFWEFSNSSPLTPVFNKTIFDHISDYQKNFDSSVTWKYYEHDYCFLRFFAKYTFDNKNIFRVDDPLNGFFADAKRGTLPTVSYIDPQFVELPPRANCDGPVADIKAGQELVKRVVEAVVTSPQFNETLLVITYDEHGGFFDHVPPPAAAPFSPDLPIKTTGVRVPAFFVSPFVKAGAVFSHDADASGETLYFDHTSILKTIATRFLGKNPPYMGPRFEAAKDLSAVLNSSIRKSQFLPFIPYNIQFNGSDFWMTVQEDSSIPGTPVIQQIQLHTAGQDFSFEQVNSRVMIRAHSGNLYLTVDAPAGRGTATPAGGVGLRTDLIYNLSAGAIKLQQQEWKITPLDPTGADKTAFIIYSALYPKKILQGTGMQGGRLTLVDKPAQLTPANAWTIASPALK